MSGERAKPFIKMILFWHNLQSFGEIPALISQLKQREQNRANVERWSEIMIIKFPRKEMLSVEVKVIESNWKLNLKKTLISC